jgi:hypothetical protein
MSLVVHAGGHLASRDEVLEYPTPEGTRTHRPVPHGTVIRLVEQALGSSNLPITDQSFAVSHGGSRLFGTLTLAGGTDYATVVGLRNSHDKSFPLSFCLGSRVFVCDNLAFSAEVVVTTKHTSRVMDRLPGLVGDGIARLVEKRGSQDRRISTYKQVEVTGMPMLHDLTLRCYRSGAIPARAIAEVLQEYDSPRHAEFAEPTLWSFFNCCTEVLKGFSDLPRRTQRLHGVVDAACGGLLLAA